MAAEKRVYVKFHSTEFDGIAPELFQVVGFDGTEAISQAFHFDIDLISSEPDINLEDLVGKAATLEISRDGIIRNIHGVISVLERAEETQFDTYSYKAVMVPRMWLMSLSRQNQIHQEQTVQQIVEQEMTQGEYCGGMLKDDLEFRLADSYGIREYTVQYEETDLNFVSRLLEHEGIFYYFDHTQERDRIIFCDENTKLDLLKPENTVSYVPPSGLASFQGQAIHNFRLRQQQISKKFLLKDYNYRKPDVNLQADADTDELRSDGGSSAGSAELGYGRLCYYGDHFKDFPEGNKLAKIRAQSLMCQQQRGSGSSDALLFEAGKLMAMQGHYAQQLDQDYLITHIRHRGGQALPGLSGGAVSGQAIAYQNDFEVIPAKVQFRPALNAVKPKLYGILTAKVDGAIDSDRAQIDSEGRYKLVMPFDISGSGEGKASRWVRKAESYGGQGTGMHFPLLKGSEVIWSCIGGDPDRPIITGVVPNPLNKSVVSAQNSTANIIKTPGNIVIEMQDGKGSGAKGKSSGATSEQQNTRHYSALTAGAEKSLVTEQHNMSLETGDAAIKESDTAADKWMNIAVNNYNTEGDNSYIRLGAVPPSADIRQNADHKTKSGILMYTDGDYQQGSNASITRTKGVTFEANAAMKASATAGYESTAALGLSSGVSLGGSLTASAALDVGYKFSCEVSIGHSWEHSVVEDGWSYKEIDGPSTTDATSLVFRASGSNEHDTPKIKALKFKRKANKVLLGLTAAAAGVTYIKAMTDADSKNDEKEDGDDFALVLSETEAATNLLYANMGATVASLVCGVIEAKLAQRINKLMQDDITRSGIIGIDKDSITLSCDGSSIVINGDGVFINGKSFIVGGLPNGAAIFTAENAEIKGMKIPRKCPDVIKLNASKAICVQSNGWIGLFADETNKIGNDSPSPAAGDRPPPPPPRTPTGRTRLVLNGKGEGGTQLYAEKSISIESKDQFKIITDNANFSADATAIGRFRDDGVTGK
jgi:type VI secretion system VgrG family protein